MELIKETDSPELKQVRDAAAQSMLRIAEQATHEGVKKLGHEILQSVSILAGKRYQIVTENKSKKFRFVIIG